MNRIVALMPVMIAALLPACGPNSMAADEISAAGGGNYATHVVAYGSSLENLDQDRLMPYELIIIEARGFAMLQERLRSRAVLYFNMWGKSCYTDETRHWPEWQPAPGELGEPDVILNHSVHCYRFDDAHVTRFLGWIEDLLAEQGSELRGIFLDDFSDERNWWAGADADRDSVWGPADGRPGWREAPETWNRERVAAIEAGALELVTAYCGSEGLLILNGSARRLDESRRFAENVGQASSEAWDRLELPGVDEGRYARPGDFLQVNGVGASGEWGDWALSEAGHGFENLQRAATLARERGLSVGLAFGETPRDGGSIYSLFLDPGHPARAWPDYLRDSPD